MPPLLKVDDIVLCTVKKIEGASVFVEIEGNGPGSIVLSEIAAGRIRNIRDYVSPNKKIVCKVLKIAPDHIELTLRRVTAKERDELLDSHKKERTFASMLKSLEIDAQKVIEKIKSSHIISDFLDEIRETPKLLEKFLTKTQATKLTSLLSQKKDKEKVIKKTFNLSSSSSQGLSDIKSILLIDKAEINYLGSSKFSLSVKNKNPKQAEKQIEFLLEEIESRAKKKHAIFSIKEK